MTNSACQHESKAVVEGSSYSQHANHLREDQHAVSIGLEAGQQFVKQNHLAAVDDEAFQGDFTRVAPLLRTVE